MYTVCHTLRDKKAIPCTLCVILYVTRRRYHVHCVSYFTCQEGDTMYTVCHTLHDKKAIPCTLCVILYVIRW